MLVLSWTVVAACGSDPSEGSGTDDGGTTEVLASTSTALDESTFQMELAKELGSVHSVEHIDGQAIAEIFPEVVRHL